MKAFDEAHGYGVVLLLSKKDAESLIAALWFVNEREENQAELEQVKSYKAALRNNRNLGNELQDAMHKLLEV